MLITGFVVIFAASSLDRHDDIESTDAATLFVFAGLVNVVAAALLIVGGVLMLGRARRGRADAGRSARCSASRSGSFGSPTIEGDSGVFVWLVIFCVPVDHGDDPVDRDSAVSRWLRAAPTESA